MKNFIKKSIVALSVMLLGSCAVEDNNVIALAETPAKLLTPSSGTNLVLNPIDADKTATTLVWDFSKNGVDSPANYFVEIAKAGTNFKTPIELGKTEGKFLSITVEKLNEKLDPTIFIPFSENSIDVRVKSSLGNGQNAVLQYSNIITLKVTPYSLALPKIAVPGNHQGWTPSKKDVPLLASSGFSKTNYEGYVSLDGEYKFLSPKPDGTFDWGTTDWGDDGTFAGVLVEQNEKNCTATKGYYLVKANTATTGAGALTYSATLITRWGVTGDATPLSWPDAATNGNQDQALSYDPTTKKWSITLALTGGKQIKFRANNDWAINLGKFQELGPNDDINKYGGENMTYGGPNIDIANSGTYIITLDVSNPRDYKYSVVLK